MIDLRGRILDRKYRLTRLLGEGGMGSVYEAEHTMLHRRAAVKVLHPEFAESTEAVERFLREAMAASAIGHPNIVEIFDVGQEDDGTTFIVMELLEGNDLGVQLALDGRLNPARVVAIVLQVLSALHEAHHKGIIHRDMKPDNVFLSVDARLREEVKLLDFGVAKVQGQLEGTEEMSMTRTGVTLGTPYYIAPEQARGRKDIDVRVDLWAVGVMLYEMLSGRLPFEGESYNEIISGVLMDDHRSLREVAPDVPASLAEIVEQALVKDRDLRYQTAAEMIGDLLPLHDEQSTYRLTSSVSLALRRHSDPPPAPTAVTVPLEVYDEDHVLDTSTSKWLLNSDIPDPGGARQAGRRWKALAAVGAGAVGAAIAAVALVLVLAGTNGERAGQGPPPPTAPAAAEVAAPVAEPPPNPTGDPARALPAEIEVELAGLPDGAAVSIDNRPVEQPVVLPASTKPIILKVTATGYHSFEQALVPDRDLNVEVSMARKASGGKTWPSHKKKRAAAKERAGSGGVWADNPFSE
jgi:serine/threonine-protein kinase